MERKASLSKRPTKGHPPPGDFIALGKQSSQSRSGSDSDLRHAGVTSAQPLGRKALLVDRKREAPSSSSGHGLALKRPKLLAQTFTPLGRSDVERRGSPALQTPQFEESAIDVEPLTFMDQVLEADNDKDDERVEGLLCGAVKHMRLARSKPDSAIYLALLYLSKTNPALFGSALVIDAFCSLLKRDVTINFKAKGNPLVSVMACNVMLAAFIEEENWPEEFVKVYLEDSLGERVWVDREDTRGLVDNIHTAFNTNLPPRSSMVTQSDKPGEQSGASSPSAFLFEDDDKSNDSEKLQQSSSLEATENFNIFPRYPYQKDGIETFVMEVVREQFNRRQPMDASSRNLIRLMMTTCGYPEVRMLASQRLEMWLQNPKLSKPAQDLLMSVCMNCEQHDKSDIEVIKMVLKIRLKTKPLINHFLLSVRELLAQHTDNMRLVLTHTIYNELSNSRNPNNMSFLLVIFQQDSEQAAKMLAEIFQDLLVNKDDYLRALRPLLREIVRSLRHDIPFSNFCLGLMQERFEIKFVDMESQFKERYVTSIVDLITLSILLSVTPSVREAAAAQARGEHRDMECLYSHHSQSAIIERDSVWWLHTVIPKLIDLKSTEYMHYLRKVLFMESPEHYYNKDNWPPEGDRGALLKLASEAPVLEDTLMRILVIGLSRDLPVTAPDAMDLADTLIKRAAMLHVDGHEVLKVERLEFIDALLNLCAYRHPENITLPKGYTAPSLAISALYWRAWNMLMIITAYNPTTFGRIVDNYPTLKCLIEMVITNNFEFPPPTTAPDDKIIEDMKNRELQVEQLEKQEILEFETHLAAASKMTCTITEHTSLLIAQLTTMNPSGITRRPPPEVLEQLKTLTNLLNIREMFCKSRDPDFLSDIIKRQGTSRSMPWLADLVESSEGSLDVLPVECLCEFLLHESPQDLARELKDEDESKPETKLKKMKLRKQEQLLSRLQTLLHDKSSDSQTTFQVLDYFLQKLSAPQTSGRQQAIKGLSMVISKYDPATNQDEAMEVEVGSEVSRYMPQHKWLLIELPALPVFDDVKNRVSAALRQACQVETDPSLVSAYIVFLSHYALNQQLQGLSEVAVELAQLIVERCAVINHLFPMEEERRTPQADLTLRSLIHLYANYLRKAKEPDRSSYAWSDTQDQILLQWENGDTATMHVLVVHSIVILLSYGPPKGDCLYEELLETWFPANHHPPSAFLLDTSEEALLLPDWLKLRMIRSKVNRVVGAALQDLEPAQLLLFVQSFGIPVTSMSNLLQCLDKASQSDSSNLEEAVVDKAYMAQLIEIQQMRGASGGDHFYSMLTQGAPKPVQEIVEERKSSPDRPVLRITPHTDKTPSLENLTDIMKSLKMLFDGTGKSSTTKSAIQSKIIQRLSFEEGFADMLITAFEEVLSEGDATGFVSSLHNHTHLSCPVVRILSAKQNVDVARLKSLFERLVSLSQNDRSVFATVVNQYLRLQKRLDQNQPTKSQDLIGGNKTGVKLDTDKLIRDIKHLDGEKDPRLESLIKKSICSAVESDRSGGVKLACQLMLNTDTQEKLPISAFNLLTDWLELLDPEFIQSAPDLQRMLIFGQENKDSTNTGTHGYQKGGQSYLLSLLTHQSSWSTLRQSMDLLLQEENLQRYNPTSVLDFLWACYNIPKIWQGRERKLPKNYSPDDVLGLTEKQLVCLADIIVAEGKQKNMSSTSKNTHVLSHDAVGGIKSEGKQPDSPASSQNMQSLKAMGEMMCEGNQKSTSSLAHDLLSPSSQDVLSSEAVSGIYCRISLVKCCLCNQETKLRVMVNHIQQKIHNDSVESVLYKQLLVDLYVQYPYIWSWLDDNTDVIYDTQSTQSGDSQLDVISHRLITTLGQAVPGKQSETRIQDANLACRKLAAQHPLLLLRQLPMLAALLKGRTQFSFGEMKQRNYLLLFTHVLGLLELLQPYIFRKEFKALEDLLEVFFDLIQAHGRKNLLKGVTEKFIGILHEFISLEPQRAAPFLQQHVQLLSRVSHQFPGLAVLKSLLAGLTLPRQTLSEGEFQSGGSTPAVTPSRPASSWTTGQLEPFKKRLKKKNIQEVLDVLHDLDETSKRKVDILQYFVEDLKRLLVTANDKCRNTAFTLVLRHIRHSPRSAPSILPAFLHCLDSQSPDIINSALQNLSDFAVLCQGHACSLLQRAFTVGINTTVETHTYISEALQLLNMENP